MLTAVCSHFEPYQCFSNFISLFPLPTSRTLFGQFKLIIYYVPHPENLIPYMPCMYLCTESLWRATNHCNSYDFLPLSQRFLSSWVWYRPCWKCIYHTNLKGSWCDVAKFSRPHLLDQFSVRFSYFTSHS